MERYFLHHIFNLFGVSCIKVNSKKFPKISNFLLFLNYLKLFLTFGYKLLFTFYLIELYEIKSFYHSEQRTNFASTIAKLEDLLYHSLCVSSYILQNLNYGKVKKCFIDLENLDFNNDFRRKYFKTCKIFMIIATIYFISTNGFYFYFLTASPYPVQILILTSMYHQGFLLLLYYFLKMIEEKLVLQMKQLRRSIDSNISNSSIESAIQIFCRIIKSFGHFREVFGLQFSLNVGFFACSITFGVSIADLSSLK